MSFLSKTLLMTHMKRICSHNCFWKSRFHANKTAYLKQRNYCVSILQKTKRKYYGNTNERCISDNKQTMKPLFLGGQSFPKISRS